MVETVKLYFADKQDVLNEILGRYPNYGRRSAVMPLLWEVQRAERHISEARLEEIAAILDLHATEVKGVMSFYSTYHEQPVGAYHLQICSTLPCALWRVQTRCATLSPKNSVSSPARRAATGALASKKSSALGSCGTAPVLQVNDTYYERVTKTRCKELLEAFKRDETPEPSFERGGDNAGADKPVIGGDA